MQCYVFLVFFDYCQVRNIYCKTEQTFPWSANGSLWNWLIRLWLAVYYVGNQHFVLLILFRKATEHELLSDTGIHRFTCDQSARWSFVNVGKLIPSPILDNCHPFVMTLVPGHGGVVVVAHVLPPLPLCPGCANLCSVWKFFCCFVHHFGCFAFLEISMKVDFLSWFWLHLYTTLHYALHYCFLFVSLHNTTWRSLLHKILHNTTAFLRRSYIDFWGYLCSKQPPILGNMISC